MNSQPLIIQCAQGYKNDTVDLNAKNNAASDKKGCC